MPRQNRPPRFRDRQRQERIQEQQREQEESRRRQLQAELAAIERNTVIENYLRIQEAEACRQANEREYQRLQAEVERERRRLAEERHRLERLRQPLAVDIPLAPPPPPTYQGQRVVHDGSSLPDSTQYYINSNALSMDYNMWSRNRDTRSRLRRDYKMPRLENKGAIRKYLSQLVDSVGLKGAESQIRCGLEFEFHKLDKEGIGLIDQAQMDADCLAHISQTSLSTLAGRNVTEADIGEGKYQPIYKLVRERTHGTWTDLPQKHQALGKEYWEILRERERDRWLRGNRRYYVKAAEIGDIEGWKEVDAYTQLGTDNSVRGGEIRTQGPVTIRDFLRVARMISRNKWEVGIDTSFHIHLSVGTPVPGMNDEEWSKYSEQPERKQDVELQHKWGARFQSEMYAYILSNLNRLPEPVRERMIQENGGAKWARFSVRNGHKYSAIYQNRDFNTWEFRIFGNITRYQDMVRCLSLAIDTLKHAYAVKLGKRKSLLADYGVDQITYALDAIYGPMDEREAEDGDDRDWRTRTKPVLEKGIGPDKFWEFLKEQSVAVRNLEEGAA